MSPKPKYLVRIRFPVSLSEKQKQAVILRLKRKGVKSFQLTENVFSLVAPRSGLFSLWALRGKTGFDYTEPKKISYLVLDKLKVEQALSFLKIIRENDVSNYSKMEGLSKVIEMGLEIICSGGLEPPGEIEIEEDKQYRVGLDEKTVERIRLNGMGNNSEKMRGAGYVSFIGQWSLNEFLKTCAEATEPEASEW